MREYEMRSLGYKRTPTTAWLRFTVETPARETWEVPLQVVADDRDENYADEEEDTVGFIRSGDLDGGELTDWAANNMFFCDVKQYARRVDEPPAVIKPADFEEAWTNAKKTVIGNI